MKIQRYESDFGVSCVVYLVLPTVITQVQEFPKNDMHCVQISMLGLRTRAKPHSIPHSIQFSRAYILEGETDNQLVNQ